MKKVLLFALCLFTLASCNNGKSPSGPSDDSQKDSLQKIIEQRDNEINDMMGILNEVEEGFRLINEAENRVSVARNGEGASRKQQIRENIQFIQQRMAENRELIAKLRNQVKNGSIKSEQLQKTIENLTKQLEEKDHQIKDLYAQLEAKDIHIEELQNTTNTLSKNVDILQDDNAQKANTINTQDKQLNTAWYVFGTKKELKEQNILVNGKVLQGNFNKNYFTKVDIRSLKAIKLYSKSAKLLTMHPSSSYKLERDAQGQYVLNISNPQLFWSTSKYLVVQVK
jgi:DNA repair exonuclease SbcCD ATPase subunit